MQATDEQYVRWSGFCEMLVRIQTLLSEIGKSLFSKGYLKPANLEEFSLAMTYFWLSSWPIGYHLNNLLKQSRSLAYEISKLDSLKSLAEAIKRDIILPFEQDEVIQFWQMMMDSIDGMDEKNARRYKDGFYGEPGAFVEKVESVLKENLIIAREAVTLWSRFADPSLTTSGNQELRQKIFEVLSKQLQEQGASEAITQEVSAADLGLDPLNLMEALMAVKEDFDGKWTLDYQGSEKLHTLRLDLLVTWIEHRLSGR